ncbi:hypothetical protein GCM10027296_25790 [Chitinimonas naiadis]
MRRTLQACCGAGTNYPGPAKSNPKAQKAFQGRWLVYKGTAGPAIDASPYTAEAELLKTMNDYTLD